MRTAQIPDTPLYVDNAEIVYGTTVRGGTGVNVYSGVIFELSPNGASYTESVLYNFCLQAGCLDGSAPRGGIVMDGDGNLFGTASEGGSSNDGLIFELSPNNGQRQYNVLQTSTAPTARGHTEH